MNHGFRQTVLALVVVTILTMGTIFGYSGAGIAATNLAKQPAVDVYVALGNEAGALQFFPDDLQFEPGRRYNLHLSNPSDQKHYFTAKDFADGIWSQKVDAGNVEIKGAIHELELRANTEAEWVFVPLRSGIYSLRCTVPGHTEAGMVGRIEVVG
ncbi:biphenyl 2,3-dioxygenase [Acaryochloris sp. 'Moss Beach']|uniref:plastocyanin/azurin family copper-binding protein n=1 Tax=Acaryochloris TaxID=155977 RepID=UPI001F185430|nr:plastocyanin/azurin family copper-binding protein [Acaryochloris sp. 'Moss Beach']UJB70972.1 biphenyl 2,3-dioxygenase [Acaryochloris sp. 'Moss Beach']